MSILEKVIILLDLIENNKKSNNDTNNNEAYVVKTLSDIKKKRERIGFIIYSKKTVKKIKDYNIKFENDYKNCKNSDKILKDEPYIHRFYYFEKDITKKENLENKLLTVIMINPAFASSENTDGTIENVYKIAKENDYTQFEIINLYSVRMPKLNKVNELIKTVKNEENTLFINKYIEKIENNILLAYGKKYCLIKDEKNIKSILNKLSHKNNQLFAARINNDGTPTHLSPQNKQYLKNNMDLIPISLYEENNKFKVKIRP